MMRHQTILLLAVGSAQPLGLMFQLLFALLSDLDLDATVLKPYTIRVDWSQSFLTIDPSPVNSAGGCKRHQTRTMRRRHWQPRAAGLQRRHTPPSARNRSDFRH